MMYYLDTFKDLKNWESGHQNNKCLINYLGQQFQERDGTLVKEKRFSRRNKVLFCHDMQGGYLDDALIEKNENIHAYRFYYWNLIDIFVYFSHHFISIPPIGWIYHCHRNGVQCLGTFIVEGFNDKNFSQLFKHGNIELVARKMTDIKNFYNFEGWLINIECSSLPETNEETVGKILLLVARLIQLGNVIYWYDSITISGSLSWQNGLTEHNKPFYDISGNIFLNYSWNEERLKKSIEMAQGNIHNVFVGIDCFGRGCPGDGGLHCNVALEIIDKVFKNNNSDNTPKFSIALFAPGWCHENGNENTRDELTWVFFKLMEKYLHPYLDGRTIYRQLPDIHINRDNSFHTNFDVGQGSSSWHHGKEISKGNYNWLMDQNLTPTGITHNHNSNLEIKILPYRKCGYRGYGCMIMVAQCSEPRLDLSHNPVTIELFRVGCILRWNKKNSLTFVLGRDVDGDQISWKIIKLVFIHSGDDSEIKITKIPLNEVKVAQFVTESGKIEWNTFKINSMSDALGSVTPLFTLRNISLEIYSFDIIKYMTKNNIYLGQLKLESKED